VRVTGCGDAASDYVVVADERHEDVITGSLVVVAGPDAQGGFSGTVALHDVDVTVQAHCAGNAYDASSPVLLDVENPLIEAVPGVAWPTLLGTDCPAGTTVTVTYAPEGGAPVVQSGIEIDELGDWAAQPPAFAPGTAVLATASCGAVTYVAVGYTLADFGTTTSTTATATSSPASAVPALQPAAAAPAEARPGVASYTG